MKGSRSWRPLRGTSWRSRQADWEREGVYNQLIAVNEEGKTAGAMPNEFSEWLVSKTKEQEWDKVRVHSYLCQPNKEGKTVFSRFGMPMWTQLSMWAKNGLQFRVENKGLAAALKTWYNSTMGPVGEETEEKAKLVKALIARRGVIVKSSSMSMSAIELWNEKNENLSIDLPCI